MKKIFWGIILLFPTLCIANHSLEFELVRTVETPGFFAVTLFPSLETQPIQKETVFVKNFPLEQSNKYEPILSFLKELGAQIVDPPIQNDSHATLVSLGEPIATEKNFHLKNEDDPLDTFEKFSLQELQPVFFQNIHADFGGNISAVEQFQTSIIGDTGVTFIGKFEKDMRTRMHIVAQKGEHSFEFESPLNLNDTTLSNSPMVAELPQLWEQLQKKTPSVSSSSFPFLSLFPWILGGIGILLLIYIFIRRSLKRYNTFLKDQESLQEEFPWQQITKSEEGHNNPFEIEERKNAHEK